LENTVKIYRIEAVDSFTSLRDYRNKSEWISGPAVVNAFSSPPSNQICFPAGILQAPFYDSQQPNYLNFGGIGSVIGHEITHGFDDRGRLYDKDGTYFADGEEGLWSPETIANYKIKAKCIIDQYSGYRANQVSLNVS
jgi:predicted metalloendopeptidase